jgi:hypothetical protein
MISDPPGDPDWTEKETILASNLIGVSKSSLPIGIPTSKYNLILLKLRSETLEIVKTA